MNSGSIQFVGLNPRKAQMPYYRKVWTLSRYGPSPSTPSQYRHEPQTLARERSCTLELVLRLQLRGDMDNSSILERQITSRSS